MIVVLNLFAVAVLMIMVSGLICIHVYQRHLRRTGDIPSITENHEIEEHLIRTGSLLPSIKGFDKYEMVVFRIGSLIFFVGSILLVVSFIM